MKTIKKAVALFAVILAVCGFAGAQDAPAEKADGSSWDARICNIRGKVFVKQNGDEGKWAPVRRGIPLEAGDRIKTGKGSKADISLDDRGILTLDGSTVIVLKTLKHKDSSFIVNVGRFVAKITGLKARMEAMQVRTPSAVAAIRGTEFALKYNTDSLETAISIFDEGNILVTSLDESGNAVGSSVMLTPRHEVLIKKEMEVITPYETKDLKTNDADIIAARKKLDTLGKTYEPMQERQRKELRKDVFSKKSGAESLNGNDERSQYGEPGDGASDRNAAKKGERSAGNAKSGPNADAPAGGENRPRSSGGASTNVSSRPGARSSDDVSLSRKNSAGTAGFMGTKSTPGAVGARSTVGTSITKSTLNTSGTQRTPAAGTIQKAPAAGTIQKAPAAGTIQKAPAAGTIQKLPAAGTIQKAPAAGTIQKAPAAGTIRKLSPTGEIQKLPTATGTTIPKLKTETSLMSKTATINTDTSRTSSPQEKNVDTIVSQLQNRLAANGNAGAISSNDLRTMVTSAMKDSSNNTEFSQRLNNDISNRLTTTTGSGGSTSGATTKTKPGITDKPIISNPGSTDRPIISKPGVADRPIILKPGIADKPIISKPIIEPGTKPELKRRP